MPLKLQTNRSLTATHIQLSFNKLMSFIIAVVLAEFFAGRFSLGVFQFSISWYFVHVFVVVVVVIVDVVAAAAAAVEKKGTL